MGHLQLVRLVTRGSCLRGTFVAVSWLFGVVACGASASELGVTQDMHDREPIPARGISIVEVELNQGTRIPIGLGADWIDEQARASVAIGSRDAVIRVHYSVDADWLPHDVEARLSLIHPDGTSESFVDARLVTGSSERGDLDGPFLFRLAASEGQTLAGTQYSVELWDLQPSIGEGHDLRAWANPADGHRPVGFVSVPLQLKLVLVPINYGGEVLDLDDDVLNSIVTNLYEQNPTTEILWDVHPGVDYPGQLASLSSLLPLMAQLRTDEDADPNVYYHALVDVGSQSLGGVHGISYVSNDTKDDAGSRVSATVMWSIDPTIAIETFTHETGHAQGLGHVQCPTVLAEEPDPSFPDAEGLIGDWGFAVRRLQVHDPAEVYDYMSYCGPSWVSDWTWNKTFERIETLTAWDFEGAPRGEPVASDQLLVGAVHTDTRGDQSWQWWTMPGGVDPARRSNTERFEFETTDGERVVAFADVTQLGDHDDQRTRWIKVVLPADLAHLSSIRYLTADQHDQADEAHQIDPAALVRPPPPLEGVWRPRF